MVFSIDGGSRGNPGPAGYGVWIVDNAGQLVDQLAGAVDNPHAVTGWTGIASGAAVNREDHYASDGTLVLGAGGGPVK